MHAGGGFVLAVYVVSAAPLVDLLAKSVFVTDCALSKLRRLLTGTASDDGQPQSRLAPAPTIARDETPPVSGPGVRFKRGSAPSGRPRATGLRTKR